MSGGGSSAKQQVADYRLSMHYGVCHGPVDALTGLFYDEKNFWTGEIKAPEILPINLPNFMGGPTKEGGLQGFVYVMHGAPDQVIDWSLAQKLGGTADTVPSFRGITSLFFTGGVGVGFYWGANSPYIRNLWVRVRRSPKGLDPDRAMIGANANPAHIIFECLTNTDWGMGSGTSAIDVDSFNRCAKTLADEGFGLSMIWTAQSSIESFVNEVLEHVDGSMSIHPRTGLLTMRLIRNDYQVDTLPEITPDNAVLSNFQRKGWGETINEINVTWTNPENEQEETITCHDLANIEMQGNIVSETRNYYGVRDAGLAMRLAQRDCAAAAYPMATCDVEVDRTAWNWAPGDVVRLTWPEYQISGLVMRVGTIDYGRPGEPRIRINLIEDIFYLPSTSIEPPSTGWDDPRVEPEPSQARVEMAPAFLIARELGAVAESLQYPEVYAMVLGNSNTTVNMAFELYHQTTNSVGGLEWTSLGLEEQADMGSIDTLFRAEYEAESTIDGFRRFIYGTVPVARPLGVSAGDLLWLARNPAAGESGRGRNQEIAVVETVNPDGTVVLRRGVLDTIPLPLDATDVWRIGAGTPGFDTTIRADGSTVNYKLLTRTMSGQLELAQAPVASGYMWNRAYLPLRPANVKMNGVLWGSSRVDTGPLTFTWSRRNRLTETSQILRWTDPDVTPEPGQTVTITIFVSGGGAGFEPGAVVAQVGGLTGTSHTFTAAALAAGVGKKLMYRIESVKDGMVSYSCVEWEFGYGTPPA
jgi:hypothetical protein